MSRPSLFILLALLSPGLTLLPAAQAAQQPPVRLLTKANPLPLAIDPAFDFRKVKTYFLEDQNVTGIREGNTEEQSIAFERKRLTFGAISPTDIRDRYGNYFTFFWKSRRPANLTVRLEYRQQKMGSFIQAREIDYPNAQGTFITNFAVNGDDYLEQGRVSAWRVLLIADHQVIVALGQSYLWR